MLTGLITALSVAFASTGVLAATQQVVVGMNMTRSFTPNNINAAVGDTINFTFVAGNHSVVQSNFAMPCSFANGSMITNGTLNSGYMPANITAGRTSSYIVTVNDTNPLWFYCSQLNHCALGMVMTVNAPTTGNMTFSTYQAAANATAANTTTTGTTSSSMMSSMSITAASSASASTSSKASSAEGRYVAGVGGAILAVGGALFVTL